MSGSRAKAKRKSAKKAAVNSAPVPVRAQTDFIIENVRCFAGEQRVPIRPITLLVGENSTGKTTFAACCYVAQKLTFLHSGKAGIEPGFNVSPFSMGGFREIVRRFGSGRALAKFRLGFATPHPNAGKFASTSFTFKGKHEKSAISGEADTAVAGISFVFADGQSLEFSEKEPNTISIKGPDFRLKKKGSLSEAPSVETLLVGMYLSTVVQKDKEGDKLSKSVRQKARRFLEDKFGMSMAPGGMQMKMILDEDSGGLGLMPPTGLTKAFAPVRSKPEWTYSLFQKTPESEGGDIPASLFRMSRNAPREWRDLQKRLISFGKESGMFSAFNIVPHGARAGGDFHLEVEARGVKSNIAGVGYGVSQIYPLLIPVMHASQKGLPMTLLLQEPEVHLHPQAQAALATFFAKSATKDRHCFIMETHGDSIIDRFRVCVRRGEIAPEDVILLYFAPDKKTGAVKIHPIHLDELGNVLDAPVGYRQFFLDETDRLLGFKE